MQDNYIIGAYIFYNLVFAATAFPAGSLADKFGMKKAFITGLDLIRYSLCRNECRPSKWLVIHLVFNLRSLCCLHRRHFKCMDQQKLQQGRTRNSHGVLQKLIQHLSSSCQHFCGIALDTIFACDCSYLFQCRSFGCDDLFCFFKSIKISLRLIG